MSDKPEQKHSTLLLFIFSLLFLIAALVISLFVGSAGISSRDFISALFCNGNSAAHSIIFDLRLPRVMLGFAVGGSLSLAGVILQSMFRNPLVEPYTVGISGGAALGASLCIILKLNSLLQSSALPFSGFIGALAVIGVLFLLNARKKTLNVEGLLLTGVMISFISSSLVTLVLAVSSSEDLHSIIFWIMGSLEQPAGPIIYVVLTVSLVCLFLSYCFSLHMNALSLGEEEASHLGINTEKAKTVLFLIAAILTGVSVSVSGLIGFVGLIVPHFVRTFTGYDHRRLLVTSFVIGSAFLIACDTVARTIVAPVQLPVGVITGIVGGAIFIYVLGGKMLIQRGHDG